jgi:hypothetical protein
MSGRVEPSTVTSGMPTHEALALLPIPARLSDAQRDGHVCVWTGEALTAETAIDLGPRTLDGRRIFPRASRTGVNRAALSALFDHVSGTENSEPCETCATSICDLGRALNRLIRMGAR